MCILCILSFRQRLPGHFVFTADSFRVSLVVDSGGSGVFGEMFWYVVDTLLANQEMYLLVT